MNSFLVYILNKKYSTILCALLFHLNLLAQDPLLDRASEFVAINPDETIKIGELLLKNDKYKSDYNNINLLVAQSYYNKGNYDLALQYLFAVSDNNNFSDSIFESYLLKADILRKLYLYKQFDLYIEKAQNLLSKHKIANKNQKQTKINSVLINAMLDRQEVEKADSLWKETNEYYDYSDEGFNRDWLLIKAGIEEENQLLDAAEHYYKKVINLEQNQPDILRSTNALIGLSNVYFQTKKYKDAISTLLEAEEKALKLEHHFLLVDIKNLLSNNYLALQDQEQHNKSYNDYLVHKTGSKKVERDAVNTAYNLINQEFEKYYDSKSKKYQNYFQISLWILILTLPLVIFYFYKNRLRVKRFKEILKYLKISSNIPLKNSNVAKQKNTKKNTILSGTEHTLLSKLKQFEVSGNFTNNEMSLANLAAQFDTNTKYLSEVINKHYNDNFNMYINRLRINYIIEKLKSDSNYLNYKISYLAEQSGFSSHSSFATVFKTITGIAPTTFISLMQKENEIKKG